MAANPRTRGPLRRAKEGRRGRARGVNGARRAASCGTSGPQMAGKRRPKAPRGPRPHRRVGCGQRPRRGHGADRQAASHDDQNAEENDLPSPAISGHEPRPGRAGLRPTSAMLAELTDFHFGAGLRPKDWPECNVVRSERTIQGYVICPNRRHPPKRVRTFIDYLGERFKLGTDQAFPCRP